MKVLVIDIGGSNVKLLLSGRTVRVKFRSGPDFTPGQLVKQTLALTQDWSYDSISIGFPSPVRDGKPLAQPNNLGRGWVGFDFSARFAKPVRIVNDAALQALGSYRKGRMLFIGLGTGFGSALVLPGLVVPLELCELRYSKTRTLEDILGKRTLKMLGNIKWERAFFEVATFLKRAFLADELVIGGGNAKFLQTPLRARMRLGNNKDALTGGERLWASRRSNRRTANAWTVL